MDFKFVFTVLLVAFVCGCTSELNDVDETTTTTTLGGPTSLEDAFRIAGESPYIDSLIEDNSCNPFTWDNIGGIVHIRNWGYVECSEGGSGEDSCKGFSGGSEVDETGKEHIKRLFGKDVGDFYVFKYLCNDELVLILLLDSTTGGIVSESSAVTSSVGVNRCSGFTTVKCFDSSVQLLSSTDTLSATFINAAGTTITIKSVGVSGDCISGTGSFGQTSLFAGDTSAFSCSVRGKDRGDEFQADVDIAYTETIAGTTIERIDVGRISGTVG